MSRDGTRPFSGDRPCRPRGAQSPESEPPHPDVDPRIPIRFQQAPQIPNRSVLSTTLISSWDHPCLGPGRSLPHGRTRRPRQPMLDVTLAPQLHWVTGARSRLYSLIRVHSNLFQGFKILDVGSK